jgi:hypothetical protein
VARLSPLGHEHINVYGEYEFVLPTSVGAGPSILYAQQELKQTTKMHWMRKARKMRRRAARAALQPVHTMSACYTRRRDSG